MRADVGRGVTFRCRVRGTPFSLASLYGHAPKSDLTSRCFIVDLAPGLGLGVIRPAASASEPSPSLPPILASPVVTAPCAVFGRQHLPTGFAAPSPSYSGTSLPASPLRVGTRSGVQLPRPNPGSTAALALPSGPVRWHQARRGPVKVSAPQNSAVANQTGPRRWQLTGGHCAGVAGEIIPARRQRMPRGRPRQGRGPPPRCSGLAGAFGLCLVAQLKASGRGTSFRPLAGFGFRFQRGPNREQDYKSTFDEVISRFEHAILSNKTCARR